MRLLLGVRPLRLLRVRLRLRLRLRLKLRVLANQVDRVRQLQVRLARQPPRRHLVRVRVRVRVRV